MLYSNIEQVGREEQLSPEIVESIFKSVSNQLKKKDWNIDDVIEAAELAGISKKVVRLSPIGNIKG